MKNLTETIKIPEGLSVSSGGTNLIIKGPKGAMKRNFNNPSVKIKIENNEIILSSNVGSQKDKAVIHAYKAHLKNAFNGVKEPYVFKLKICSGHFPMNVTVSNNVLVIKNFLGEKIPRQLNICCRRKILLN